MVAGIDGGQPIPEVFLPAGGAAYEPDSSHDVISNLTLLIQAAAEAGQLAKLKQLVQPLVAEKVPAADALLTMVLIAASDAAAVPRLAELTAVTRDRLAKKMAPASDDDPFGRTSSRSRWNGLSFWSLMRCFPSRSSLVQRRHLPGY